MAETRFGFTVQVPEPGKPAPLIPYKKKISRYSTICFSTAHSAKAIQEIFAKLDPTGGVVAGAFLIMGVTDGGKYATFMVPDFVMDKNGVFIPIDSLSRER